MSKYRLYLSLACLLVGLNLHSGCALFRDATPAKVAVNISDTSTITVEAALAAWNDYIPLGKPSLLQQAQVEQAWEKYRRAQIVLLDAAIVLKQSETAGLSTEESTKALNAALADASQALIDLIHLLREFKVRI